MDKAYKHLHKGCFTNPNPATGSLIYIQTLCSGYVGLKSVSMLPVPPFAWLESHQSCLQSPDVGAFSNYLVALFVAAAIHPD